MRALIRSGLVIAALAGTGAAFSAPASAQGVDPAACTAATAKVTADQKAVTTNRRSVSRAKARARAKRRQRPKASPKRPAPVTGLPGALPQASPAPPPPPQRRPRPGVFKRGGQFGNGIARQRVGKMRALGHHDRVYAEDAFLPRLHEHIRFDIHRAQILQSAKGVL